MKTGFRSCVSWCPDLQKTAFNMPNKNLLLALLVLVLAACRKEETSVPAPPPLPPPTEYVPIFAPCDTSNGVATANKLTAAWKAGVSCRSVLNSGKKYWVIDMFTCSSDGTNSFRERFSFFGTPDNNPIQHYSIADFTTSIVDGAVDPSYVTLLYDGDVVEDFYRIDTAATTDFVQIDRWDTVNKRAEGRFSVSFSIKEPRANAQNPKKVQFTSGKFWVKLP